MARAAKIDLRRFQQELATRLAAKTAAQVESSRLGLDCGGEQWLVRLADAGEVIAVPGVTPVPHTRRWYLGVANVRGNLYGVIDFAGGIVVHVTAGAAALVAALVLGPREGYPHTPMPPHNLTMTAAGTGMLWVGWFGFNAGSALAANGTAGMAALVTHLSPCVAALTWMTIEWAKFGKASMLGFATGAIAGLAAITPAAGTVGPIGAIAIGMASGAICYYGATSLKHWGGYDDSLDAFGVHGVGGFVGTMLAAVFASSALGGSVVDLAIGHQLLVQFVCAAAGGLWSALVAVVALKIADAAVGLRVEEADERNGLDLALHNEVGYNY